MTFDPRVLPGDRARGQNVVHLQNVVFLIQSFLEVHILTTTYQKAFILRPYVPSRVLFNYMTSDPRVHDQGWGSRSEYSTSSKCVTYVFSRSPELDNHLSENIQPLIIGTLYGWLSFHAIGPHGLCPVVELEVKF